MPFPAGASTIVVTGTLTAPVGGTPAQGKVVFTPSARLVDSGHDRIYSGGSVEVTLDEDGSFSVTLLRTDSAGVEPAGWRWRVDEQIDRIQRSTYWIELTAAMGVTVDLSDIAAVSAPTGAIGVPPTGPAGGALTGNYPNPNLSAGTIALFDVSGAASSAVSTHTGATDPHGDRAYADSGITSAVAAHVAASDPHGDRADAAVKYAPLTQAERVLTPTGDAAADATAINNAIQSMATFGGGRVRLSGEAWTVSSSITPRSRVKLAGSPGTTLAHTANSNIIYAKTIAFTDFTVEGITFLGSVNEFPASPKRARTTSGAGAQTAVFLTGDLDTTDTGQAQLTNFVMRNCAVRNCSALPIRIGGVRGKVVVTGCEFTNNQDVGFIFCEEVIFNGNHVQQSADNGVSLSRGCKKITCVGNTFENCAYNGIWVSGFNTDKGPQNFVVSGNVVKNVGHNGVYADYAPKYGAITGNEIDLGFFRGPSDEPSNINSAGIYLGGYPISDRANPTDWAQGIAVVGNHIRQAARSGVYLNGVRRIQIVGNQIADIGTQFLADGTTAIASSDATQNVGILLENTSTSSDVTVSLNSVVDSRATPYCNWGVVPQNVSGINAYLNTMVGARNSSNLWETGPTRTWQSQQILNQNLRATAGVTAGSNAGTGTIAGFDCNGAAGSTRLLSGVLTGGLRRWTVRGNSAAESGSNAGTDLEFNAYADDGTTVLSTPIKVTRSTGQITLAGHRVSGTAAATVAAGAQSASATAGSNGANGSSGVVNTTAVASPAAGTIATVTYASAYPATPKVVVTPRNAASVAAGLYVTSESTTGFSVATANAPGASASLSFSYQVEG